MEDEQIKILLVEDDDLTNRFYELVFGHAGFQVFKSEDVNEIFSLLETEKINLVILDINLRHTVLNDKVVSGIDISKMIKENEKFKDVKIVLVSAYVLNTRHPDFIESKADGFILKPIVDFNRFLEAIREYI